MLSKVERDPEYVVVVVRDLLKNMPSMNPNHMSYVVHSHQS